MSDAVYVNCDFFIVKSRNICMNTLCIDIGGTNIRVGFGDGKKISNIAAESVNRNVSSQITRLANDFPDFDYAVIASAGPIDIKRGIFNGSPNFPLNSTKISAIGKKLGAPAILINECVAAAVGEKFYGAGKNTDNLAYVTWSTGIGCGPIVDGRIILGKDGNAHEAGHIVVDIDGRMKCMCGKRGHWEAYCGGKNIPRFAETFFEKYGVRCAKIRDAKHLFGLAKKDKTAARIVDEICRINGIGIANIVNTYDPELVTIGGAIMLNNKGLIGKMAAYAGRFTINRMPKIIVTPLAGEAVLYGAMAMPSYLNMDARGTELPVTRI